MIPMGSIGPGPSRDPNDPDSEHETTLQAFGWEIGIVSVVLILVFSLLGFSTYVDQKDKDLQLYEIPQQHQNQENK